MPNRIVNIVSYSYKGGSGRSTAALNIAFELARQGKLVALVDLDIGAPGLHMILSEWDDAIGDRVRANDGAVGVQTFLNLTRTAKEGDLDKLEDAIIEVDRLKSREHLFKDNGGKLLCLFCSTRNRVISHLADNSETVRQFHANYKILQQAIASRLAGQSGREVYVVIDAPNGITPVSLPLLKGADLILMFYRHSLQHVQGTVETAKKVRYYLLPEIGRRFVRIILVGSCVPQDLIGGLSSAAAAGADALPGADPRKMFQKFSEIQEGLERIKTTYPEVVSLRVGDEEGCIIEDEVLKVLEQPLLRADLKRGHLGLKTQPEALVSEKTRAKIELIATRLQDYAEEVLRRKYPHSG